MKSFIRMALSFFALVIVLFVVALLFSPQVRTAFTTQSGESAIGQLKSDSTLKSVGQPQQEPANLITPEQSAAQENRQDNVQPNQPDAQQGTQSGATSN